MTAINATNPWNLRAMEAQSSGNNETNSTSGSSLSANKLEFLNLLVAQLKNQDPLNPMDSKDFVAQLATFSSLEQLIDINKAVTKLAEADEQTSGGANGDSTNRTSNV